MIFWIIVILIAIAAVFWFINEGVDWADAFMALFVWAVISFVAGGVLFLLGFAVPQNGERTDTEYQLRAIGTDSSIEGRFYFLGGGYVDGERVLNYITESEDGAVRVGMADADRSVLYEDATPETATLTIHDWNGHIWWLMPWEVPYYDTYTFHIPADSVVEGYEVSAQ